MAELTYDDFKNKLSIQNVLIDAGYTLNRRDGLRYPSYVRLDSEGRRIRGVPAAYAEELQRHQFHQGASRNVL